jgi:hypothetical protein
LFGATVQAGAVSPTVDSDFSLLVVLYQEGRIEIFKYHGSEVI